MGVAAMVCCSFWMLASETLRGVVTGRQEGAVLESPLGPTDGATGDGEFWGLERLARRSAAADSRAMIERRSRAGVAGVSAGFCQG